MTLAQHKAMAQDMKDLTDRWRRAGFDITAMHHEMLTMAFVVLVETSYSRENMLANLDDMIARIHHTKERVAVDWAHLQQFKAQGVRRVQNEDHRPTLFP